MMTLSSVPSKIEVTKKMTKKQKSTMRTMAKGVVSAVDKLTEIKSAYRELWEAVENGTVDESFFELREKVRRLLDD